MSKPNLKKIIRRMKWVLEDPHLSGWQPEMTGGDHIRLTHPAVKGFIICAQTPGDRRGLNNVKSLMRRAMETGVVPGYRGGEGR